MVNRATGTREAPRLTPRQLAVLQGIARRETIKVIAGDLQISESAVNQHIKALKARFDVHSLADLSAIYSDFSATSMPADCRKAAYRKNHLPEATHLVNEPLQDEIQPVQSFHDAMTYQRRAPWEGIEQLSVSPGVLNGANGRWYRLAAIVVITVGLFVAVVVGLGAARSLSDTIAEWQTGPARS